MKKATIAATAGIAVTAFAAPTIASASTVVVFYTHLRAHETRHDPVSRFLLEKKTHHTLPTSSHVFRPTQNHHSLTPLTSHTAYHY
ncbi:hypothetical protein LKL48_15620, partial [Listeria monocytogenes]|nr:hypothetical protein [Listeria monocytogenes]